MARKKMDRLSVTLGKILKARGMQDRLHEYRVFSRWKEVAGQAIARHAEPRALRGGKLVLAVDSPAWMQQLSLLKPELIEKLNSSLGGKSIRDVTLKLGEVAAPHDQASEEGPAGVALTPGEREQIERHLLGAGDSDIRDMVRRVMERDFLSRKARGR
jgi:hypothetical protein